MLYYQRPLDGVERSTLCASFSLYYDRPISGLGITDVEEKAIKDDEVMVVQRKSKIVSKKHAKVGQNRMRSGDEVLAHALHVLMLTHGQD